MGRYGLVGLSGVLVNLGLLWVLTRWLPVGNPNAASAVAIEGSILWNFWLHDRWTFHDRVEATVRVWSRVLRFHTVAAFGAFLQWATFAGFNDFIACATSLVPHAERAMERLGVGHHFESVFDIVASDYIPKPEPVVYDVLVDLHGIDPTRAVFFEDMARNLEPAKARGMTTVWIEGHSEKFHYLNRLESQPSSLSGSR